MKSLCNFALSGLRVAALLGLLVGGVQSVANAGVLTYTAGTGGTFDPSTSSTFTFTSFGAGSLSPSVTYTDVRVLAKWGGTAPFPGAFNITSVSTANPGTTSGLANVVFGASVASGATKANGFATLDTPFTTSTLSAVSLTVTIPTLTVSDGWTLSFALDFTDDPTQQPGSNTNPTAFQTVSALNGGSSVPEPGTSALAGGLVALAIFVQRRRAKRTSSIDNNAV